MTPVLALGMVVGAALLGDGYDSQADTWVPPCLKGTLRYEGSAVSSVHFEAPQLQHVDPATTALTYTYEYRGRFAVLTDVVPLEPPRHVCGDRFVERMELGGRLSVQVHLAFRDPGAEAAFVDGAELPRAGLEDLFSLISLAGEQQQDPGVITLSFEQEGGDPRRLAVLLGGKTSPFLRCSFHDLPACQNAVANIVDYVVRSDGLRAQVVDPVYDPEQPTGPAVLWYGLQSYSNADLAQPGGNL